jgi:hypothetical protein
MSGGKSKLKLKGDYPASPKKRKLTRFTPELEQREGSVTPPRHSKARTDVYVFDFDDVRAPPEDDYEPDKASFEERLADVSRLDDPEAWEGLYSQPAPMPLRWQRRDGPRKAPNGLETEQVINEHGAVLNKYMFDLYSKEGMTEDDYAEHIRLGMWRRTHKEEVLRQQEAEKERIAKAERDRVERERLQREEADRIRKHEERKKLKAAEASREMRDGYSAAWTKLLAGAASTDALSYIDVPWPVDPANPRFDAPSVFQFLTGHIPEAKGRKAALRTAVLAYHPDRFDRFVSRVPEARGERARVRELGLMLSQTLNELLSDLS